MNQPEIKTFVPGTPGKQKITKTRVSESDVEGYLVRQVEKDGGTARKWASPGKRSVHDRICIFEGSDIWLVEAKAPDGKKSPGQKDFHDLLYNDIKCRRSITVWCKADVRIFLGLRRTLHNNKRDLSVAELNLLRELQTGRVEH